MLPGSRQSPRGGLGVVVLLGLIAAGGLIYWLSVPSDADGSAFRHDGALVRSTPPAAQVEPALPELIDDSVRTLDVATPTDVVLPTEPVPPPEAEVRHVARERYPGRMFVDPEYFAQKYAAVPTAELEAIKAALADEIGKGMHEASAAFLDAGGGETAILPRPPAGELELPPGEKSDGLILTERTRVTADGSLQVQKGKLPWDQFTSLYDKQDEQRWLIVELRRRQKLAASSETALTPSDGK